MMMRKTLVVSDNTQIIRSFAEAISALGCEGLVDIARTKAPSMDENHVGIVDVKEEYRNIIQNYDLVISGHCKQIFPPVLVDEIECINIHPGHNPETRGWYPQVWGIINGDKTGFTVHRMDSELDHGDIIYREEVYVYFDDTSETVYNRILNLETKYIYENLGKILLGDYSVTQMEDEGNLYLRKDFEAINFFDLGDTNTFGSFFNRMRALSHGDFKNAYVEDPSTGKRVFFKIEILSA